MAQPNLVPVVYTSVVNDVINNVREAFLEESVDEQALQELKQLWESKLRQSKAVEGLQPDQEHMVSVYAQQQQQMQQQQQKQRQQQQQQQAIQAQSSVAPTQPAVHLPLFNPATGTVDLSGAAQAATIALPAGLYHQQMAALGGGQTIIQAQGGTQYIIQAGPGQMLQPTTTVATSIAPAPNVTTQQQQQQQQQPMIQLDGNNDSSSDDEDDANDEDEDDHEDEEAADAEQEEEEEPLCSDDDVSDEEAGAASDTENVVVCQFDKIHRSKNRWKFHLKDGIMNLNGRDYVFQKATGDAEW